MNAWLQDKLAIVMTKCGAADNLQCSTALLAIQLEEFTLSMLHMKEKDIGMI